MTRYQRNRRAGVIALTVAIALPFLLAQVGPSGGLPSRPFFRTVEVGSARLAGASDGAIHLVSTTPTARLYETDAGADEKYWNLSASADCLRLLTRTDANGAGATPLNICRTGTNVDSIALAGDAVTINGAAPLFADGAGSGGALGFARVRTNSSGTILADRNVASVTNPAGTGTWQVNFDADVFDSQPSCSCTIMAAAGMCSNTGTGGHSGTVFSIETRNTTGSVTDLGFDLVCIL